MVKARNPLMDVLKGYAMFLVIWGHAYQCMGEGLEMFDRPVVRFIYLFHMPLFFFISGYVSVNALSKSVKSVFVSRIRSLFIPMCVWAFVSWTGKLSLHLISVPHSFVPLAKSLAGEIIGAYWFILTLLYCIFYARIVLSSGKDSRKGWLLGGSAVLLLLFPNIPIPGIWWNGFKIFYLFFVAGYLFKYYAVFDTIHKHLNTCAAIAGGGILLTFCLCRGKSDFVYFLNLDIWASSVHLPDLVYHLGFLAVAGISGILLSYLLFRYILRYDPLGWLADMGKHTLRMYLIQGVVFNVFLAAWKVDLHNQILYFFSAAIITLAVWKFAERIQKSRLSLLQLAGKYMRTS